MTLCRRAALAAVVLCSTALPVRAADPELFDPAVDLRVADVRPGMTGYGLTVLQGNHVDRFDCRVVSVLHDFNPRSDVVLITFAGHGLEHTTAIAGMSGSPIYLYDPARPGDAAHAKLLGAFAYGWAQQKDPIAGVQPIEYMLRLPADDARPTTEPAAPGGTVPLGRPVPLERSAGPVRWSLSDVHLPGLGGRHAAEPEAAGMIPLATPLMTAALPPRVLAQVGPLFRAAGLIPTQGGGGDTATDDLIVPGAVLGVPLVTGDVDMSAIGTCTAVVGDHVLAFGHPLDGDGPCALPFCGGQIQGVVASYNSSFKMGSVSAVRGTLTQDQTVGIAGHLGPGPATVPVRLRVVYADGSSDVTYHFTVVRHPKLTPLLAATAMAAALTGAKELPPHHTADFDLSLAFAGGRTVRVADAGVDLTAADLFTAVGGPVVAAAENPFGAVPVERITGTVTVSAEERSAQILYATVAHARYRPGEVVTALVTYRPFRGDERVLPVRIPLPRDLPDGTYPLTVSDADKYLADERSAEPFRFSAETTAQVFDVLRDVAGLRHDAVYARLLRQPDSVAVGHTALAKLPGSRRQILIGSGRSDVTPFVSSSQAVVPTGRVMTGSADFEVTVDRHADDER